MEWVEASEVALGLADEVQSRFACIEPGYIRDWKVLPAGGQHTATQHLVAER
jgi:hypothetical protein